MAYFDDPENYAWWQNELASLRAERERRLNTDFEESPPDIEPQKEAFTKAAKSTAAAPAQTADLSAERFTGKEKISLEQLEKELLSAKSAPSMERTASGVKTASKGEPITYAQLEQDVGLARKTKTIAPDMQKPKQKTAVMR